MFLYTSGSTGRPKGVVLSHYSHLWAISQRVRRPVPQGQRSLVAAPLYHMNGLAMCQTTFSHGDTVVLLPQFTTRGYIEAAAKHTRRLPDLGADHDRHDAAREGAAGEDRPLRRRGGAHGLGADHPGADRPGARGLSRRPRSATATARPRPDPSCSARIPRASRSPSCRPAIRIPRSSSAWCATARKSQDEGELEMKCGALMTHYHKLPETTAKVMTPDGYYRTSDVFRRDENGFFYLRRPGRRHVRVRRREHLSGRGREDAGEASRHPSGRRHPGARRAEGPQAGRLRRAAPTAPTLDEQAVKTYALANAPAYQHPRRVFFVDEMPLAGTNKIDKRVLRASRSRTAGTEISETR